MYVADNVSFRIYKLYGNILKQKIKKSDSRNYVYDSFGKIYKCEVPLNTRNAAYCSLLSVWWCTVTYSLRGPPIKTEHCLQIYPMRRGADFIIVTTGRVQCEWTYFFKPFLSFLPLSIAPRRVASRSV